MPVFIPLKKRFEDKISPEPMSGCWLWTAAASEHGYGKIGLGGRAAGEAKAHRVSWILYRGEIAEGLDVCHKCDTPACVNPDHLFLGDHKANMEDMCAKGRHPNSKKTHCRRGHSLSGDNLAYTTAGSRQCVICNKASKIRHYKRNKQIKFLASDSPALVTWGTT